VWPRSKSHALSNYMPRRRVNHQLSKFPRVTANEGLYTRMSIITHSTWCKADVPKHRCK
jgi:hypothetical protein